LSSKRSLKVNALSHSLQGLSLIVILCLNDSVVCPCFVPDGKCCVSVVERPAHGDQCCVRVKLAVRDTKRYVTMSQLSDVFFKHERVNCKAWTNWTLLLVYIPSPSLGLVQAFLGCQNWSTCHYLFIPKYAAIHRMWLQARVSPISELLRIVRVSKSHGTRAGEQASHRREKSKAVADKKLQDSHIPIS
jgi:hypothetical protein